jgi:PBP1b-binding outer membrane lipoprotein LpoB
MEITKQEGRGIRLTKTSLKYYKIHLELTNLNTALIEWTDEYEFARETSRPIIGW